MKIITEEELEVLAEEYAEGESCYVDAFYGFKNGYKKAMAQLGYTETKTVNGVKYKLRKKREKP
jgi:hypothetical protein